MSALNRGNLLKKKNLHLIISTIIIIVVSLTDGLFPTSILPTLFDFKMASIDLKHIFRAIMGLYLGMVVLWIIGILKPFYWQTATISNVCFMMGLALGRIVSLVVDRVPSISFSTGLALELVLSVWGIVNLKKCRATADQ